MCTTKNEIPKRWKEYLTDVLDTKGILRLIESISSPKNDKKFLDKK